MKKDQYWLKSAILTVFQNMSSVLLGFGSFYVLVRLLSKHDLGAWVLFMSTTGIIDSARNGLVGSALIRFLSAAKREEHGNIITASFTINATVSLICIIANFCFAGYLARLWGSPELANMFYLYNVVFILSGISSQFNCIEQANFSYKGISASSIIRQSLFFAYIAFCYIRGIDIPLISLVYVQIVSALLAAVIAFIYIRKNFFFSFTFQAEWIKKLFNYGKYAFGTTISAMVSNSIDQMMLGGLLSTAAAASYNIAVRITNLVEIPTGSIATIVFPQSARRLETGGKEAVKYLYEKSVGTVLAILLPGLLFLFVFSGYVIDFIAGAKYEESIPILKITILYCLLIPYGRQFGTILDSIGRTKLTFSIVLITGGTNALLNFVLISRYGVMGAAYATLISNIIGFVIAQVILRRELNISIYNTLIYTARFYPEFIDKYLRRKPAEDPAA